MAKLSVIVHTKNSADTLGDCLESVSVMADEIIVMDMESTDDTRRVARQFKAKVLRAKDVGYADPARNKALQAASGDWALVVDADEEIPPTLADAIVSLIKQPEQFSAFAFPRKNIIFGRWARAGWWPDFQLRLFKKGHVYWPPQLHGKPQVEGQVRHLPADEQFAILHHNYNDIDSFVDRAQRYSSIAATEVAKGERASETDLWHAWWQQFVQRWFADQGYQDQHYGQTLAMLQSYFEVLVQAKYWQAQGFKLPGTLPPLSQQLAAAAADARYWEAHNHWQSSKGLTKIYWRLRMRFKL